jgi:hypothetical protein
MDSSGSGLVPGTYEYSTKSLVLIKRKKIINQLGYYHLKKASAQLS